MYYPDYEEASRYEKDYNIIPVCREIYADVVTPITLLRKLAQVDSRFFLLESVEGGNRWGRYSFLGVNPLMRISAKAGTVTLKSGAIEQQEKKEPNLISPPLLSAIHISHASSTPPPQRRRRL